MLNVIAYFKSYHMFDNVVGITIEINNSIELITFITLLNMIQY